MSVASELSGVEAYRHACHCDPTLERLGARRSGISLYGWGVKPDREMHVPKTRELTLAVHLRGGQRVRVITEDGPSQRFSQPGNITLIPRGQAITFITDGESNFATAHFPDHIASLLRDRVADRLLRLPHCLFAMRDDYVVSTVQALMRRSGLPSRDDRRYASYLLEALTWHLVRIVDDGNAEAVQLSQQAYRRARRGLTPKLDAVLAYIEMRLGDPLPLAELSDVAGVGRSRFAEAFTAEVGCTPHRYLLRRRIERACDLLRDGAVTVSTLAYELGFSSPSHFAARFKSLTGRTPTEFAEMSGRLSRTATAARKH